MGFDDRIKQVEEDHNRFVRRVFNEVVATYSKNEEKWLQDTLVENGYKYAVDLKDSKFIKLLLKNSKVKIGYIGTHKRIIFIGGKEVSTLEYTY